VTASEVQKRYSDTIDAAIAMARATRDCAAVAAPDGAEVYAYPKSEGRIAWGVNAAETDVNILRGVRRPDGADEAVSDRCAR
jgi:hypothetical protein